MMKKLNSTISLVVISMLAVGGASVGATSAPPSSDPGNGTEPAASAPDDAAWDAVVEAAKEEGALTWYSVAPQAARDGLQEAFAEIYPEIELDIRVMTLAEMEAALQAERDTGAEGADVVTSVNYAWIFDRAEEGWFVDLAGPAVASGWQGTEYLIDNQVLVAPIGLIVLGWNTTLLEEGIESYEDLLDPSLGGGAIGMARAEPAIHADYWAFLEDNLGEAFLEGLAGQDPTLYPSAFALQQALGAGEVAVGGFVSATDMVGMQEDGLPVDYVVPNPAWTVQNMFYVVESADHPNAAQVFMDFVASPEGQLASATHGFSPLREVTPQTLGGSSDIVLADIDRMLEPGWYEDFLARWQELFEG